MDVKHEPESRKPLDVLRHYIGDLVYGANDGLVTTFTIVSGVTGARLETAIILILGLVNLLGDGFSMGASNYLAIRSRPGHEGIDRGRREPLLHALATFGSFVIVGALPLLAFLVPGAKEHAFAASCVVTGVALFLVGSLRSVILDRSKLRCGLEMLLIGGVAAGVAFGVGALARSWVR